MDIEFSHTNLTSLPSNLHEKWHPIAALYIEHSLITEFLSTLLYLQPFELSLHENLIEQLPELVDVHQYFYSLVLSVNPLRMIPAMIGEGTFFSNFSAENTLLETLPAWTQSTIDGTMYLYGTPYCNSMTQMSDIVDGGVTLACETWDNRVDGKVPIDLIDPRIPLTSSELLSYVLGLAIVWNTTVHSSAMVTRYARVLEYWFKVLLKNE